MVDKKSSIWDPEGGLVKPYEHIVQHAMSRYLTPKLRADLKRRARRTARRCRGTGTGSIADAVELGLDDLKIPTMIITLLPQLFSDTLVQSVLDWEKRHKQNWEKRDRSLDHWMEQIVAADFDQPAEEVGQPRRSYSQTQSRLSLVEEVIGARRCGYECCLVIKV